MFLVNSRPGSFVATIHQLMYGDPYPEVTDAILPSSLTQFNSFALVYSTTPPVLVCGTVSHNSRSDGFLGNRRVRTFSAKRNIWNPRSTLPADLPTGINALRVPRAVNAHASILPFRHTAPRIHISFSQNIIPANGSQRLKKLSIHTLGRFM